MAWVLKMDEVIESGLVHDFDASLSGIGQELGAGAYSMRYGAPCAGREGGRAPPYPWERPAGPWAFARRGCDPRSPGLPGSGSGPCRVAVGAREPRRPLPTRVAGCEGRPATFAPGAAEGFTLAVQLGVVGEGVSFPCK